MGNSSDIDTSVAALYATWRLFRAGKRASRDIIRFEYRLEEELMALSSELSNGNYRHSRYQTFVVNESKRRQIAVASVRDRVVHRLLYEYLVALYDKTFCYDVWSCRPGKGLDQAADRVRHHMRVYRDGWLWRSDVTKFFDSVDHAVLMKLMRQRVPGERALLLLDTVVGSHTVLDRQTDRQTDLLVLRLAI